MDIEVRKPQATGRDPSGGKKSKGGGGPDPDKTKAIVAGVILLIAVGVLAWQMGLLNFGGDALDPVQVEQQNAQWEEVQKEEEKRWKSYERQTGRKRPVPSGS